MIFLQRIYYRWCLYYMSNIKSGLAALVENMASNMKWKHYNIPWKALAVMMILESFKKVLKIIIYIKYIYSKIQIIWYIIQIYIFQNLEIMWRNDTWKNLYFCIQKCIGCQEEKYCSDSRYVMKYDYFRVILNFRMINWTILLDCMTA